jgi:hypothetical protein
VRGSEAITRLLRIYEMSELARGNVLKAYLEIDPFSQNCGRICLFLEGFNWIEFTGVTLQDGFFLPSPLGCNCTVTDISARQWELAKYEITFDSSYSHEGTFYAKLANQTETIDL